MGSTLCGQITFSVRCDSAEKYSSIWCINFNSLCSDTATHTARREPPGRTLVFLFYFCCILSILTTFIQFFTACFSFIGLAVANMHLATNLVMNSIVGLYYG